MDARPTRVRGEATVTLTDPTLYRAQLVRLPLQQATFGEIPEAGRRLGLPRELAGGLGGRLDQEGNLHLDQARGRLLARTLVESLTDAGAQALQSSLESACDALTTGIEPTTGGLDVHDVRMGGHLSGMARLVATVVDFAILGRFVPDALLEGLARAGDGRPPPFPSPSSGSRLTEDLLDLYQSLIPRGKSLADLTIPGAPLDHQVERELRAFADRHVGFGPLAWDRPGFEDPAHVLVAMIASFEGGGAQPPETELPGGPSELPAPDARSAQVPGTFPVQAVRRLLAAWLAFLDAETWYVRRAFFLGYVPVLRELVAEYRREVPEIRPGDVLFCTSPHQAAADPGEWLAEAKARREAYVEDRQYLARHGIDEGRLDAIVERSWGSS